MNLILLEEDVSTSSGLLGFVGVFFKHLWELLTDFNVFDVPVLYILIGIIVLRIIIKFIAGK